MTLSSEWDKEFRGGRHLSRYPWSDLVSFVNRYTDVNKVVKEWTDVDKLPQVLELGCGIGTNYSLFSSHYYRGVDGSLEAVDVARRRYGYQSRWAVADFTKEIPFGDTKFDLIFDRAAVTHNDTESIKRCIELVRNRLKPGGKYIGIDWFSTSHSDFIRRKSVTVVDYHTKSNFKRGSFKGVGKVHFFSYHELLGLFAGFDIDALEHKAVSQYLPKGGSIIASWNFCCTLK